MPELVIDVCWFCHVRWGRTGLEHCERLYRLDGRTGVLTGMNTQVVRVPRCSECAAAHARAEERRVSIAQAAASMRKTSMASLMAAFLISGYAVVLARLSLPRGVRSIHSARSFPVVKDLKAYGWKKVKGPYTFLGFD